tara:strand:+ start:863 stop:2530 length:1668 start_codon:yes stop_codon:yes gene_type:complete
MEDDKLLGERMFDAIENGAVGSMQWLQKQAEDDPDRYTDDMLRLLGGGVKNVGWALSKVPFLDKIAQGEDWLAGKAREMSAELTPQLDPRFAGWGTRIGTGILADKGIGKAVKGAKYLNKVGAAKLMDNIPAQAVYADTAKDVSTRMADATKFKNSEIRRLGKQLLYDLQHPTASIPKLVRDRTTPQIRYRQIFNNDPSHRYPSIEDLDLATRNTQFENPRINWKKERLKYTPTSATKWTAIGKRLQKEYGGSDEFVKGFIKRQRDTVATTQGEIKWLNEQMPIEYLQFALTDMVAPNRKAWDGAIMTRLTDDEIIDLTYDLFYRLATKKPKYFDYGHVKSAKNLAAETAAGTLTTADFASNIRPEIAHSIRDFYKLDPKGPNFSQILAGKKKPKSTDFKIIEPGNIARGRRQDMNDFVNMFMSYSPNVEHEYVKALGDWGVAMDNIIPFEWHDHFTEYLRKGIRKWQGSEKGGLLGAYQLRFYPREIRKLMDDYLNNLRDGNFPEELARKDFKVQEAIDEIEGIKATADELAKQRAVVRNEMPDSLKKDFKNPE